MRRCRWHSSVPRCATCGIFSQLCHCELQLGVICRCRSENACCWRRTQAPLAHCSLRQGLAGARSKLRTPGHAKILSRTQNSRHRPANRPEAAHTRAVQHCHSARITSHTPSSCSASGTLPATAAYGMPWLRTARAALALRPGRDSGLTPTSQRSARPGRPRAGCSPTAGKAAHVSALVASKGMRAAAHS